MLDSASRRVAAALGDDTRWRILELLSERPRSVSALADQLPISRQAIDKHVKVLAAAGLVDPEPRGSSIEYRALGTTLSKLARDLDRIGAGWDRRLQALQQLAERRAQDEPDAPLPSQATDGDLS